MGRSCAPQRHWLREARAATAVSQQPKRNARTCAGGRGSRDILTAALEAERSAIEAQKGAEQIAAAAEEQSSSAAEAQTAVEQQARSLDQGQLAAQGLASLAEEIRTARARTSSLEQISVSAEELSAAIQQLSGTSAQVMTAIGQINKASQLQSAATHETSAALGQIENNARRTQQNGSTARDRVNSVEVALREGRNSIGGLIEGVATALQSAQSGVVTLKRLEAVSLAS